MLKRPFVAAALSAVSALSLTACGAEDGGPRTEDRHETPTAPPDTGRELGAQVDALKDALDGALPDGALPGKAATVAHPARDAILATLPRSIGAYARKDLKLKSAVPNFAEFSVTYAGGGKELKVVVNDFVNRDGSAFRPRNWRTEIEASGTLIGGHPALTESLDGKHTTMILLSDRIRLDVKSRVETAAAVETLAKGIDLSALTALAEGLPD